MIPQKDDHLLSDRGWLQVTETTESEIVHNEGLPYAHVHMRAHTRTRTHTQQTKIEEIVLHENFVLEKQSVALRMTSRYSELQSYHLYK